MNISIWFVFYSLFKPRFTKDNLKFYIDFYIVLSGSWLINAWINFFWSKKFELTYFIDYFLFDVIELVYCILLWLEIHRKLYILFSPCIWRGGGVFSYYVYLLRTENISKSLYFMGRWIELKFDFKRKFHKSL